MSVPGPKGYALNRTRNERAGELDGGSKITCTLRLPHFGHFKRLARSLIGIRTEGGFERGVTDRSQI